MPEEKRESLLSAAARTDPSRVKSIARIRELLAEYEGTNGVVLTPHESSDVINVNPQDALTPKAFSGRLGDLDKEPANVLNREGLSLPEYAKRRGIQVKSVRSAETSGTGKLLNPDRLPLPVYLKQLVESREQRKKNRPQEKAA